MTKYFVPYSGTLPAIVHINGHKLIVVSTDENEIEECLGLLGADSLRLLEEEEIAEPGKEQLEELAQLVEGGVVVAPDDIGLDQILSDLEDELPWIQ